MVLEQAADPLVPYQWFLVIAGILAFTIVVLALFNVRASKLIILLRFAEGRPAAPRTVRSQSEVRGFLRERARRAAVQPTAGAEQPLPSGTIGAWMKGSSAKKRPAEAASSEERLQPKRTLVVPKKSVMDRLESLAGGEPQEKREVTGGGAVERAESSRRDTERLIASMKRQAESGAISKETFEAATKRVAPPAGAPPPVARVERLSALQSSKRVTVSVLSSLKEQYEKGVISRETFEEMERRLSPRAA